MLSKVQKVEIVCSPRKLNVTILRIKIKKMNFSQQNG